MTQAKGSAVVALADFIKGKQGDTNYKKWIEALSPEAKAVFTSSILPSTWFDLKSILAKPTELMCKMFYQGTVLGAFDCGKYSADIGLRGVYKVFVKLGSPNFIIGKASSIIPNYYKPSTMETVSNEKNLAIVRITSFQDLDIYIENRIAGWMQRALEISGCKNINVKIPVSLTNGGGKTEYHVTWT